MSPAPETTPPDPAPRPLLAEVRYSLPELLAEIRAERSAGTFGMERLDQSEIGKLFKSKAARGKAKA